MEFDKQSKSFNCYEQINLTESENQNDVSEALNDESNSKHPTDQLVPETKPNGKNKKGQWIADNLKSSAAEKFKMLPIDRLKPYCNHPFKLYEGKRLDDMVSSVKEYGVISRIIVRPAGDNDYEILSGHNRVNAAKLAGFKTISAIVKTSLSEEEARLIVTETNLQQRSFSDLTYSERVVCLKQHYDAIKCQGKRNDLIDEIETLLKSYDGKTKGACSQVENSKKSFSKVGKKYSLSKDTVARYIRLSNLNHSLLEQLDNGRIVFMSAYQLSFIEDIHIQNQIAEYLQVDNKLDMSKAEILRRYYENGNLNDETLSQILYESKDLKLKPFSIKTAILEQFFSAEQSKSEIERIVVDALQFYCNNNFCKDEPIEQLHAEPKEG